MCQPHANDVALLIFIIILTGKLTHNAQVSWKMQVSSKWLPGFPLRVSKFCVSSILQQGVLQATGFVWHLYLELEAMVNIQSLSVFSQLLESYAELCPISLPSSLF